MLNNKIDFETLSKVENEFGNFEIGQVHGGGNPIYLRFGYWNRVDVVKLNEILGYHATAIEDDWYDDDEDYYENRHVPSYLKFVNENLKK